MESNHIKCLKNVTSIIEKLSHLLLKVCFSKKKKLTEKAIWKWVIPAKCNKGLELMF